MFRFILTALIATAAFASPALAQYRNYPDVNRGYSANRRAYPQDPDTLVRTWYQKYLDRNVDPNYMSWVGALNAGQAPEMVLATILASDEYYLKSTGTPEGFVRTLFRDLTGRRPTQSEYDFWMRRAYYDERRDIAYAMLMRHPQTWEATPYDPGSASPYDYDYRRPFIRYYRR